MYNKRLWLNRLPVFVLMMGCIFFGAKTCLSASSITARENLDILIKTKRCSGCDLSGLNLNRMDLSGADLEGADLSLCKMFLTNLSQANLKNAKLNGAVFGGADLGDADLRGADLRGANLEGAYLGGALLEGKFVTATPYADAGVPDLQKEVYIADPAQPKKKPEKKDIQLAKPRIFSEPPPPPTLDLEQPEPEVTELKDTLILETPVVERRSIMPQAPQKKTLMAIAPVTLNVENVKAAGLTKEMAGKKTESPTAKDSEYDEKNIPEVVEIAPVRSEIISKPLPTISKVELVSINDQEKQNYLKILEKNKRCYGCNLSKLDLSGKDLRNVDLEKANLAEINFQGADLSGANLKDTNLQGANLKASILVQTDFYNADLSGADLTDADVSSANFDNANISTAIGLK